MIPDVKNVSFKFNHFDCVFVDAVVEEEIVNVDYLGQKIHVYLDNPVDLVGAHVLYILEQEDLQSFDCCFYDFRVDER